MKTTNRQLNKQAKEALRACLEKTPFVSIRSFKKAGERRREQDADFFVQLKTPSGSHEIVMEVKSNGQPRIVRGAVLKLLRLIKERPAIYGVVAAPYISPRAAEICAKENIGFVDFAGNCRLCFGNIFIEQTENPNPSVVRREQRSLFSPKAERVLRVLFMNPKKKWRIAALAQEAGVSLGQVFNVKNLLLDKELISTDEGGIVLTDPDLLFSMWELAYVPRKNSLEFFTLRSPAEFEADLAKLCILQRIPYALTGFSAASRYAPAVRSNRAMAYINGNIDEVAKELGLKPVRRGSNVILIAPYDDGVYYDSKKIDGINIVSPIQAYLDLGGFRAAGNEAAEKIFRGRTGGFIGRSSEAAEMIFKNRIKPTW